MPRRLFQRAAKGKDPSFRHISQLASSSHFDVSVTACAIRWVELGGEPCALLCYQDGRLKWHFRSRTFFYDLPPLGTEPPAESLALEIVLGRPESPDLVCVSPDRWFSPEGRTQEVLESTFGVPGSSRILALIFAVEES
jgi:hypothetical protein